MRLDKFDVKIIMTILFLEKDITSTQLAKIIFAPNTRSSLQDKDANLRKRLNKLVRYGILEKERNENKWCYQLKKGSIFLGFKSKDNQFIWFQVP